MARTHVYERGVACIDADAVFPAFLHGLLHCGEQRRDIRRGILVILAVATP